MQSSYHIRTEELELYLLDRVSGPGLARLEEHLLWCQDCVDRADALQRFLDLIRAGKIKTVYEVKLLTGGRIDPRS